MSNKTFNMSTEQVECTAPLPHRDLLLSPSPESHYSISSLSPSPNSNSCISNLSDREGDSSPDINMLESLSDSSHMDNLYDATIPQAIAFCDEDVNLNQTFIATPLNGNVNFWNENLSLISYHENGSENNQTFSKSSVDGSDSAVMSPDSAGRESQLASCETSRRGSTENDCSSLSSGEMVMRSNSFCLDDQSHLVVSSLDESSIAQVAGCSTLPAESYLLSNTLPDVCENFKERVLKEEIGHPCLGKTFIQAESPTTEENNNSTSNLLIALPDENEGVFFMTFVCEQSPDSEEEAQSPGAEAEMVTLLAQFAPGQGKAVVSTLSATQDIDKYIQTSTPIQTIGSTKPNLPSLSESPCTEQAVTPGLPPGKQKQVSGTILQPLVAGLHLASKIKKREIKKFPKSDFSKIKSKVVTRNMHQMSGAGNASQHQLSQVNINKPAESHRGAATRASPAKERSRAAGVSTTAKLSNDATRQVNSGASNLGATGMRSTGHCAVDGQDKSVVSQPCQLASVNTHAVAVECSNACSKTEHAAASQLADTASEHAGNETFCFSSLEKSPDESGKPTPNKGASKKIEVRSGSALGQDNPPVLKSRPRCLSESLSSASLLTRAQRTTPRFSTSLTIPKADKQLGKTKPGTLKCSSQNKQAVQSESTNRDAENAKRGVKRISLVVESSKSTGAPLNDSKSRFREGPSPRQVRRAPLFQPPAANPRQATLSVRQRQGTVGRDECKTSKGAETVLQKQKSNTGGQRIQTTGGSFLGTASSASNKPQLYRCQTPQTPTRSSLMGPPQTPASRLPRKTLGPSRSLGEAGVKAELSEGAGSTQVPGGAAHKQTPFRTAVLKAKLITSPKTIAQTALGSVCKPSAPTIKGSQSSLVSPLKRTASARLRLTKGPVDKSKPKTCSHPQQQPQQQASQPKQSNGPPDVVPASVSEGGTKKQSTDKLQGLLAASDRRFEAVAIVLQKTLSEREEATKHCRELSQELVDLRGELVCSVHSSERLEKEKDELRVALEDALHKLQEQHQRDLAELEQRLQTFYQDEWDKVHLTYQEEADKCKNVMQKQMEELKANQEAIQLELENSHAQQLQCVQQHHETSLEEFRKIHNQELQSLDRSLKDAEAALTKDSHTLYLEQELESLKVVLDIRNKQLHQQEKKLMEVDKLKEKNVKLDEGLQKVQQENEDLKARMDRHAALSRQLSSEQAVLQESLHKESKVNKRLSMENEELLWKLHNGDLSSPRKASPNAASPSHSFSLSSPRSSGVFSSPPLSPR
ncbi:microtubule-associated tumor suppressor 1 homolog A isoform X2 [Notolabrus celidotus]|uniref:microtubule-associated tumor suppressor 1 homolog A isoform X2 n=1 Tax=Notolabrus celidotus TaxID=1203425 RepID=UPI001490204E|nr:microtubule-associated tumor suppressor 1 homolog A isoform X2 [Notolabrus celidotus]XP_034545275.1 microtubule-associated tumor suppressor 1 homolog A isoform X2 [Notolabrus celidotus]